MGLSAWTTPHIAFGPVAIDHVAAAIVTAVLGAFTVSALIGFGYTVGLYAGLGSRSLIKVRPSRVLFDAGLSIAMCWLAWSRYGKAGRLRLDSLNAVGFSLAKGVPQWWAVALAVATCGLAFLRAWRAARRAWPGSTSAPVVLCRSLSDTSRYYDYERTFDQWLLSEAKALVWFVSATLLPFTDGIRGNPAEVLQKAGQKRDQRTASAGAPSGRPAETRSASVPAAALIVLTSVALWAAPRWWSQLRGFVGPLMLRGFGLSPHAAAGWLAGLADTSQRARLSGLDIAVLALIVVVAAVRRPPLLIRVALAAAGSCYLAIAIALIALARAEPLWTVLTAVLVGGALWWSARVDQTWVSAAALGSGSRDRPGFGGHARLAVGLAAATAVLCAVTDIWASQWSYSWAGKPDAYSAGWKMLLAAALPAVLYVFALHLVISIATGHRLAPLKSAALWAGIGGLAIAALLVWLGGLPGVAVINGHAVTGYMTWGGTGRPQYYPLPADWRTGPLMFAVGFTLTISARVFSACGKWTAPASAHIGATI